MSERRRFVIEATECGKIVSLDDREAVHCLRALRLGGGEIVEGVDGCGWVYTLELRPVSRGKVRALVLKKRRCERSVALDVVVALGLIKGPRMDWAVEKCAELGARAFVPFMSERVVASTVGSGAKTQRWRRIAGAALKQSLGAHVMRVSEPRRFSYVEKLAAAVETALVGDEEAPPLRLRARESMDGKPCLLVIGPEGSLTPQEYARLESCGGVRFSLGRSRLRSETAVVAGLAALLQELGWGAPAVGQGLYGESFS